MAGVQRADMVGRDGEMTVLAAAVDAARRQEPSFVLVEGEAGIGKSRLVDEAVRRWQRPGDLVVVSHGVELAGGDIPYGMVGDTLRDLGRQEERGVRTAAGEARRTLTDLTTALGGESPAIDRGLLLDAFVTLAESLARRRLVWWVIEDLHWADTSSRDVLGYLAGVVGPCQLLVTASVRTDTSWSPSLTEFVAGLARLPRVSRLRLEPLGPNDVADHVRSLSPVPVPRRVVDRIVRLVDGIPFWTEELVFGRLGESGPVPDSIRDLLNSRLVRLDPNTRMVVEAVSLSDMASHQALARVCGLDDDAVEAACVEAVRAEVLVVSDDGSGYQFRHALLREAVSGSLLPGRRQRLHRRWAEELDRGAADMGSAQRRVDAARHWARAGESGRALEAFWTAAGAAQRMSKPAPRTSTSGGYEHASLMQNVLDLWPKVPDAADRLRVSRSQLVVRCIAAHFAAGRYEDCLAVLDDESDRPDDDVQDLYLRLRRHVVMEELARENDDTEVLEHLDEAAAVLLDAPIDNPWLAAALVMCAYYLADDDATQAMKLAQRAIEAAQRSGNLAEEMHAVDSLSWNLAGLGRFDAAIEVLDAGVRRSRKGAPSWASDLEGSMAWYLWAQGRYPESMAAARSALRYIKRPKAAAERFAWITESLAESLISAGEWDEARRRLDECLDMSIKGQAAVTLNCLAGLLACYRGDEDEARTALARARVHIPPQEDTLLSQRVPPRLLAAELAAAQGDLATVRSQLAPLWDEPHPEVVSEMLWRPLLVQARAEADAALLPVTSARVGERGPDLVWERLLSVANALYDLGDVTKAWRSQLFAEQSRANDGDDAALWQDVADHWDRLNQPFELGWALLRVARCRLSTGDRVGATAPLDRARALANELGALPLGAAALAMARRAGLDATPTVPNQRPEPAGEAARLTARELEVLRLVARGHDNAAVAKELFISTKTASVHVSHILAKLGVSSRTQAASLALRRGLVDDADL